MFVYFIFMHVIFLRYALSTLDTTMEGGVDDMAVGDATALRRQVLYTLSLTDT